VLEIKNVQFIIKKCLWTDMKISRKFKHGCRWKKVGKYGKRKFCCLFINVCNEKKKRNVIKKKKDVN